MQSLWGLMMRIFSESFSRSSLRKLAAEQHVKRARITEDLQEQYAEAVRLRMHVARENEKTIDEGFGDRLREAE